MLKKTTLILSSIILISLAHGETCPSIENIHNHNLNGWAVFDIDNGTPLSSERLEEFTQHVQQFALAEWMDGAPEGSGHCYYDESQFYGNAYLAKQNLVADNNNHQWIPQGNDVMQCRVDINACQFMEKIE